MCESLCVQLIQSFILCIDTLCVLAGSLMSHLGNVCEVNS